MPAVRLNASIAKRIAPWLGMAALVAVLDQATKTALAASFRPGEILEITGFFNLVFVYNRGAAFSFLSDAAGWQREFLIGIAAIAAVVIVALLARHPGERLFCAGLALILGGALGNVCDRVVLGHVVDFLDFHALGRHWPAFNLADSAISVGAALLILDGFRGRVANPGNARP